MPSLTTIDTDALKWVREALEIGRDAASNEATRYHESMAGFRQAQHDARDAEVASIDSAVMLVRALEARALAPSGAPDLDGLGLAGLTPEQLLARAGQLESENEALREQLGAKLVSETVITGLVPHQNGFSLGLEGGACRLFAEAFADQLKGTGAENYVQVSFTSKSTLPGEQLLVTIQRCSGKTPHQLRRDAEAESARLRGLLTAAGVEDGVTLLPRVG